MGSLRRAISLTLALALVVLSPGIEGTLAFGQMIRSARIQKGGSGQTSLSRISPVQALRITPGSFTLKTGLKTTLPSVAPAVSIMDHGAWTALPAPILSEVTGAPLAPVLLGPAPMKTTVSKTPQSPVSASQQIKTGVQKLTASRSSSAKSRVLASLFTGSLSRNGPAAVVAGDLSARISKTPGLTLAPFNKRSGSDGRFKLTVTVEGAAALTRDKALLKDLVENPPAAVIFDYDNTLTDRGEDGLSLPTPAPIIDGLKALLEAGIPVGIISARNFDHQGKDAEFPNTLWEPLLSKIPAELRYNLFVSGGVGAELVLFNKKGVPVRYLQGDWTKKEKKSIFSILDRAMTDLDISAEDVNFVKDSPAQIVARFTTVDDPRAGDYAKRLQQAFDEAGLEYNVHRNKEFVYFSKFTKGRGISLIYTAMLTRGHPVTEKNLLIGGDEFRLPHGGDAAMALTFPDSRGYTVGDLPEHDVPANIRRLETAGSQGSHLVINAVREGLAKKTQVKKTSRLTPRLKLLLSFAAGSALTLMAPWLWANPQVAAIAGTVILSAIGLPQIWKNFKVGPKGTKDLAMRSYLIWFGASVFLTATSLLNGSSFWWLVANAAGVIESLFVIGQLSYHRKNSGGHLKTLAAVAAPLGVAAVVAAGLWLPAATWASVVFFSAMALLLVLNMPQILQNYALYEKEGRAPTGLAPLYPALVVIGSMLHLFVAATSGNIFWMINGILAIVTAGIVVLQIYAPHFINRVLRPAMKLLEKFKKK